MSIMGVLAVVVDEGRLDLHANDALAFAVLAPFPYSIRLFRPNTSYTQYPSALSKLPGNYVRTGYMYAFHEYIF